MRRRSTLGPVSDPSHRLFAALVAVVVLLSACTADTFGSTEGYKVECTALQADVWPKRNEPSTYYNAMAVDPCGDIVVAGWNLLPGTSDQKVLIAKYAVDASDPVWTTEISGAKEIDAGFEGARGLVVDGAGSIFLTGAFRGENPLDAADSAAAGDAFVAKLSPAGEFLWFALSHRPEYDVGNDIALHTDSGDVIIVGDCVNAASDDQDLFVMRFGPDGQARWSSCISSPGSDSATEVEVDGSTVAVAGSSEGNLSVGELTLPSHGLRDAIILIGEAGPDGPLWREGRAIGTSGEDYLTAMVAAKGALFFTIACGGGSLADGIAPQAVECEANDSVLSRYTANPLEKSWATDFGAFWTEGMAANDDSLLLAGSFTDAFTLNTTAEMLTGPVYMDEPLETALVVQIDRNGAILDVWTASSAGPQSMDNISANEIVFSPTGSFYTSGEGHGSWSLLGRALELSFESSFTGTYLVRGP